MFPNIELILAPPETPSRMDLREFSLHSLEGTIQRVNYRTSELRVIAEGRPWEFALSDRCRLWFNGSIAPFRCFQPLDRIRVFYADHGSGLIAEELFLWVEEPAKHRAEQRLAETERWLAAILEGVDDAVIATDAENQIRFMNLGGEALTGWRNEDAIGVPFAAVCNLVEDRGRIALDELADRAVCESRGVPLPATTRLVGRSGKETPVEGSLSPIYDAHGEFLGIALTLRSISARLKLERVRCQSKEQPRQSQP